MSKWQRTLDLTSEWAKASDGEMSVQNLAGIIARKLRGLRSFGDQFIDDQRNEIADWFDDLSGDENARTEDFDDVMRELYDWADTKLSGDGGA